MQSLSHYFAGHNKQLRGRRSKGRKKEERRERGVERRKNVQSLSHYFEGHNKQLRGRRRNGRKKEERRERGVDRKKMCDLYHITLQAITSN